MPGRRSPPRPTRRELSASGSPRPSACTRSTLADESRAAYHAGAAVASNYLVTLRQAAGSLLEAAGAPPEALDPLMRGVIDNGFELTGPIARGDWETVDRHLAAIRAERPELEELYSVLAEATAAIAGTKLPGDKAGGTRWERQADGLPDDSGRSRAARESRRGLGRTGAHDGVASRRPPFAPARGPRRVRHGRHEPLRQPRAVRRSRRSGPLSP